MNELEFFETTSEIPGYFLSMGYDIPFWDIIEVIKLHNKRRYNKSTEERAIETFRQMWNSLLSKQEPERLTLKVYKIEMILIDYLIWEIKNNNKEASYE